VLPAIAAGFGASISQAGAVLTSYLIPYGAMQPVYGFVSDRLGKAKLLRWIVCGLAIGTAGCAFASSLWMLCVLRAITGFFAAGIIAVSLALIGDSVPVNERQVYVGKFMGIVFLGQGLSSGLGGILARYISWRVAFIVFAVAAAVAVLLLRKLPETPTDLVDHKGFFAEVMRVVMTPKGVVIFPLAFATGFLLIGMYSYLGAFLHEVTHLDYLRVGAVTMFYGFACMLAGSCVGNMGKVFGQKRTVITGACIAWVSSLIMALLPCWEVGWLATVGIGFGYIFIQSTFATIAFDVASETKGLPSALIGLGLFGGGGLGTSFSGCILHAYDYRVLWLVLGAGILMLAVIASKLRFDSKK
jgi:predicted MFS family arabinose efflux permease